MDGSEIAIDIVEEAERIEREKDGQALTVEEQRTVTAAIFLRQIAPYWFPPKKSNEQAH